MDIVSQLAAVALVIGLLAATVWTTRRGRLFSFQFARRNRRSIRQLESLERMSLSPQHSLHLVRVAGETILVAVHPSGCSLIEKVSVRGSADADGARMLAGGER